MRVRVQASAEAARPRLTGAVMGAGSTGRYPVLASPPIRHPRGAGMGIEPETSMTAMALGKSRVCHQATNDAGKKIAILNFGTLLPYALEAAKAANATVIDMRFVKPLDDEAVVQAAHAHDVLVTLEDGCIAGGAGSAVN